MAAACLAVILSACAPTGGGEDAQVPIPIDRTATLAASCSGCHAGSGAAIISLDGLSAETIAAALNAYRSDTAGTTVMHRIARGYSADDVEQLSAYLAAQPHENTR